MSGYCLDCGNQICMCDDIKTYKDNKMITINSTIEEIEEVYHTKFHQIPHTKTFGILIEKLKISEELNVEMLKAFYKIHALESIIDIERVCESIIEKNEVIK